MKKQEDKTQSIKIPFIIAVRILTPWFDEETKQEVPVPSKIIFNMPMPASRSKADKAAHKGQPYTKTPDIDNLLKGFLDTIYKNDAHVWSVWAEKKWADVPSIVIEPIEENV